jgi:YebC/PmpR family DNA-binding regulatory protein
MPGDTITRSIKKAAGELGNINYENIVYEGYGPGGVAVIVEALTDNRNRTASEVRHSFDKNGGSLGATGCVAWMFERKGVIAIEKAGVDEDEVMLLAIDAGASDVQSDDEMLEVITDTASFSGVREALEKAGLNFVEADVEMVPSNTVDVSEETQEKVQNLLDMLEDDDDVQNVYHNAVM